MGNITPFNEENPEQWRQQNEEALQKVEEFKRIDILLTDIMMPYMNGIELAKKWKNR